MHGKGLGSVFTTSLFTWICGRVPADLHWLANHLGTAYKSLHRDVVEDQFIKVDNNLDPVIPGPLRSSMYVRPLYWKLLDKLEAASKTNASIVTGNPGRATE